MNADVQRARERVVEISSRVLAGLESPILAARELSRMASRCGVPESDPDFTAFVAIDSETDSLPVGRARQRWAADALAALTGDIARAEAWAISFGREAFESVVRRFSRAA